MDTHAIYKKKVNCKHICNIRKMVPCKPRKLFDLIHENTSFYQVLEGYSLLQFVGIFINSIKQHGSKVTKHGNNRLVLNRAEDDYFLEKR